MKEHCDHCAPFSMNKKIRPDPWDDSTPTDTVSSAIQTLRVWVVTQDPKIAAEDNVAGLLRCVSS